MEWEPLFQNDKEQKDISQLISHIGEVSFHSDTANPGLHLGSAGNSVFNAYLYKHYKSKKYLIRAENQLQLSLDYLSQKELSFSFCEGVAGICWCLFHLIEIGTLGTRYSKLIGEEINELIVKYARNNLKIGQYDFLYKGLGSGVYLMHHMKNSKIHHELIGMTHDLAEAGERSENGITWPYIFDSDTQGYSLGLAHGIPSIIIFLCILISKGLQNEFIDKLIIDAVNWLLKTKLKNNRLSCFTSIYDYKKPLDESRLGWCYGDLSVAMCIWKAGVSCNNISWKGEAISIMKHASKRKDLMENGIRDAGFCHGSIGVAHIFNRFYQETKIKQFKETAIYWYNVTIKYSNLEADNVGFCSYRYDKEKGEYREKTKSLLDGITGIGLGLLTSISNIEPKWDRAFLLS